MPCWFGVITNHLQPRPTKPPTQRSSVILSRIAVCRYHKGGGHNKTIVLVVTRVKGIGPVLLILEGGRCVCPFVSGLHRLRWQHWVFLFGPGGQNLHPTSHPTLLPHVSNWPTGLMSVGAHDTTIPPSLCYLLAFPSASYAVVTHLIVLSNRHTKKYIQWKRYDWDVNSICHGLDSFHLQCDNKHIKMDVELELLHGALDVLARSYNTG
jgi:hypothetical protein